MNRIKKITSRKIDNKVIDKINELDRAVKIHFKNWYRSTTSTTLIVLSILLIGVLHYYFTLNNSLVRLVVAVAYLVSIAIFIKRRTKNIHTLKKNWKNITKYTAIILRSIKQSEPGKKTRTICYAIYLDVYQENTSSKVKKLHVVGSFLRLLPDKDETFDIIYKRMIDFIKDIVLMQIIRYVVFIVLFSAISIFIKNSVILEMNFGSIFETVLYPFKYFIETFKNIVYN